jgi:polo-like kinase 1
METKQLYAAKIIQKQSLTKSRSKQKLITEIKIHRSLMNEFIV